MKINVLLNHAKEHSSGSPPYKVMLISRLAPLNLQQHKISGTRSYFRNGELSQLIKAVSHYLDRQ